jgi:hypothetical protein
MRQQGARLFDRALDFTRVFSGADRSSDVNLRGYLLELSPRPLQTQPQAPAQGRDQIATSTPGSANRHQQEGRSQVRSRTTADLLVGGVLSSCPRGLGRKRLRAQYLAPAPSPADEGTFQQLCRECIRYRTKVDRLAAPFRASDFAPQFSPRIFGIELREFAQQFFGFLVAWHWHSNLHFYDLVATNPVLGR